MNRDIKALDEALTHLFKEKGFPGIAVTIRGPEGILFEKGYGMRDISHQLPADENHNLWHRIDEQIHHGACLRDSSDGKESWIWRIRSQNTFRNYIFQVFRMNA